jgi:hypothetical protein
VLAQDGLGLLGPGDASAPRGDPDLQAQRSLRGVPVEGLNEKERGRDARLEEGGVGPKGDAIIVGGSRRGARGRCRPWGTNPPGWPSRARLTLLGTVLGCLFARPPRCGGVRPYVYPHGNTQI